MCGMRVNVELKIIEILHKIVKATVAHFNYETMLGQQQQEQQ